MSNPQYLGYLFPTFSKMVWYAPYKQIGIVFTLNNKLGYSDGFLDQHAIGRDTVLKEIKLFLDPYHLATAKDGQSIWSKEFGRKIWQQVYEFMRGALFTENEEEFKVSVFISLNIFVYIIFVA